MSTIAVVLFLKTTSNGERLNFLGALLGAAFGSSSAIIGALFLESHKTFRSRRAELAVFVRAVTIIEDGLRLMSDEIYEEVPEWRITDPSELDSALRRIFRGMELLDLAVNRAVYVVSDALLIAAFDEARHWLAEDREVFERAQARLKVADDDAAEDGRAIAREASHRGAALRSVQIARELAG
jgi:hypothetical protein